MRTFALFFATTGLLVLLASPLPAPGQQVLVDDPSSVPTGAAQLEAWHSLEESSMAAAVRVLPLFEVGGSVSFVPSGPPDRRAVEYAAESKVLLRPGSAHRIGLAAVGGLGFRRIGRPRGRPDSFFGYGILSQKVLPDRLTAYQNLGWVHPDGGPHRLTWGLRLDWALSDRLSVIGEVAGEGRMDPTLQTVLRTVLRPDHVEMDVSVTRAGPFSNRETWATLGLTFMSAALY